jgi:hypothetical protein
MKDQTKNVKKSGRCPNCKTITQFEGKMGQKIKIICPNCGVEGVYYFKLEQIQKNKILRNILLSSLIILIIFLFIFSATNEISLETIYISSFIGILIIKELTDNYTPKNLKNILNIFIIGLFIIFVLIIINKFSDIIFA